MLKIILKTANFKQYIGPVIPSDESMENVEKTFSKLIGEHVKDSMSEFDDIDVHRHYLCSTIIDVPFGSKKIHWPRMQNAMQQYTKYAPNAFINAYECASWGYSLRHALRKQKEKRYVLLTLVDLNLMNIEFWQANSNWGDSGFGVTTVLLECLYDETQELVPVEASSNVMNMGVARGNNAIAEFTLAMRTQTISKPELKLAYPYFPKNVTELFYRLIPKADFLPDHHPEFGHCFGADPWISIIKDQLNNKLEQSYLAASVALNGYWALAEIHVNQQSSVYLEKVSV